MRGDLMRDLALFPGDRVLDLGCGTGYWTFLAASRIGIHGSILGVDVDPQSIEIARNRCEEDVLKRIIAFDVSTVESFSASQQSFDVVLLFNILSYLDDPASCLRRVLPLLRPGGRIFVKDSDIQTDFFHPVPLDLYWDIIKAALGGPSPALVGNFDPFFARKIPLILKTFSDLRVTAHSRSFSFFKPVSIEERRFISANAAMLADIASRNGAVEAVRRWSELFEIERTENIFESDEFLYSINEFVFQLTFRD